MRGLVVALLAGGLGAFTAPMPAAAAGTVSPIGNESVFGIAVSPAYRQTGLVVAMSVASSGCTGSACGHIWVSHNGGAAWARAQARGWSGGQMQVVVGAGGHEMVLSGGNTQMQRSDDAAQSFSNFGGAGTAAPSPTFASDALLAVAGGQSPDYLLRGDKMQAVRGSGGTNVDLQFMLSPQYPSGGAYSPVLLSEADKSGGLPVIQRCTIDFVCSGATTLAGSVTFSAPVSLLPSTAYASDGTVFARSGRGIYKSIDGGVTFVNIPIGTTGAKATATAGMALSPTYREAGPDRAAYTAVLQVFEDPKDPSKNHAEGGVYKTTDGGATWARTGSGSPLDDGATTVALGPDGRLFAGFASARSGSGLLCSVDGSKWTTTCPAVGAAGSSTATRAGATPGHTGGCSGAGCTPGATGGSPQALGLPGTEATPSADAQVAGSAVAASAANHARTGLAGWIVALVAVVVLGAVGAGAWYWRRTRGGRSAPVP